MAKKKKSKKRTGKAPYGYLIGTKTPRKKPGRKKGKRVAGRSARRKK